MKNLEKCIKKKDIRLMPDMQNDSYIKYVEQNVIYDINYIINNVIYDINNILNCVMWQFLASQYRYKSDIFKEVQKEILKETEFIDSAQAQRNKDWSIRASNCGGQKLINMGQ